MRIAILEDDPDQLALLRRWLADAGHDVHGYMAGREAMKHAGRESFDLFILDWQVPDVSGAEVLTWLRANVSKHVPVLFITVRDSEEDIVYALENGADDYMVKPARRQEMLARVSALLRRAYPREEQTQLSFPPFEIDTQRGEIRRDGIAHRAHAEGVRAGGGAVPQHRPPDVARPSAGVGLGPQRRPRDPHRGHPRQPGEEEARSATRERATGWCRSTTTAIGWSSSAPTAARPRADCNRRSCRSA